MTTTPHTALTLCLLLAISFWSIWKTVWHLSGDVGGVEAKTIKAAQIAQTRKVQWALALAGLVIPIFTHGIWLEAIAASVGFLCQSFLLARKEKNLIEEIEALHLNASILCLNLGTTDHSEKGLSLRLWFKRGVESWPLAELQVGIGINAFPIEMVPVEMLHQFVNPRIASAYGCDETAAIFQQISADLQKHGVSHPIDIQGWNHTPVIRDLIERILAA